MISVIIPTLNEVDTIHLLIGDLQRCDSITQIIVVDGGSTDDTEDVCENFSVDFLKTARGKANQMNMGVTIAANQYLLFLHADSRLESSALQVLEEAFEVYPSGCFRLAFDKEGWLYSLYAYFSRFNNSLFTYGDQGLFVRKEIFEEVGGYTELPFMEDIDMVQKLKKVCGFKKLKAPIITSARRFEQNGIIKQQILNIWLVLLYKCGVSPKALKKYYPY